ncbi:MAG: Gfo/Idh/MocA family oxidoreductase [Pirellulaceae bacterium]|jgi:predicted dehydrogenase|nr:Gfo/Idh/MocA family oxidoreductase [Pirellulaceae bacterium]MCU0973882.1 Gfo/Idh/MocA family oxidoreductase [Burkholderiales bacterium]
MNRPVKIALIGTGEIGQVHAQAHASVEGTDLCIAALVQPEVEQRLAQQYAAQLYPSVDAVLDDPTVDAVDICLPNDLHRQYAVQAFEAGKHVLCEKPIALTLADADAMLEAARRTQRFLMIGHVLRFWPEYRRAKEALDAGDVGAPLAISARRMVSLLAGTRGDRDWRHDPRRSGGAVLDMQIHDLDMFCWFFDGRPSTVFSRGLRSPDGAWSHVFTHLEFPGGRQAFVEASFMLRGNPIDIYFRVLGSEKSIEFTFQPASFALHDLGQQPGAAGGPTLVLYAWKEQPQPLYVPQTDSFPVAFHDEMAYFTQCIRAGEPPRIGTGEQARQALEIALASARSCETAQPVPLGGTLQ